MVKPTIVVDRLRIGIQGSGLDIVNDLSFSIAPGEVLGLVGESGSGKTTVGLALLGHARRGAEIKSGSVRIGDIDVLELDQAERQRLLFERLGAEPRPWHARFVCVVALAVPGRATRWFRGERQGELVEPRSAGYGFGYDPVFLVPELGKTYAEMAPAEKHAWSHRAAAVQALIASGALAKLQG